MSELLQDAPQGMGHAVDLWNKLPEDIFAEMCQDVMRVLQYKLGQVNCQGFVEKTNAAAGGYRVDEKSMQSAINAVTYIYRSAAQSSLSAQNLSEQLSRSALYTPKVVAVLKHIWEQQGRLLLSSEITQLLNVGQLVDLKWKLGVAMSSDSCRNLNVPYVSLTLVIAETAGRQVSKNIEMTLPEFQKFSNQMKEMSAVLETI